MPCGGLALQGGSLAKGAQEGVTASVRNLAGVAVQQQDFTTGEARNSLLTASLPMHGA